MIFGGRGLLVTWMDEDTAQDITEILKENPSDEEVCDSRHHSGELAKAVVFRLTS